jgi:hypothetical protein
MTEFDSDSEFEPEEEELAEEAPEQSSNRTFILVALGLGGLFVIGLVCIGLYLFVIRPNQGSSVQQTSVAQLTQNAIVQTEAFLQANPPTDTPAPTDVPPPTNTPEPLPSDTPVISGPLVQQPTATFTLTSTSGPSPTPSRTPTRLGGQVATAVDSTGTAIAQLNVTASATTGGTGGGIGATFTPTRIGGGLTRTNTPPAVIGGGAETRTPTPTALPDTGFADNLGGPGLFIAAIVLVAVVFFARQLRLRNS